jgi:hypothetical protein
MIDRNISILIGFCRYLAHKGKQRHSPLKVDHVDDVFFSTPESFQEKQRPEYGSIMSFVSLKLQKLTSFL